METSSLSTDAVPASRRLDAWREFIARSVAECDIASVGDGPFRAAAVSLGLPEVDVLFASRSDSDNRVYRWAPRLGDGAEAVALTLVRRGRACALQNGREAMAGPRGAILHAAPSLTSVRDDFAAVTVGLPVPRIRAAAPEFNPAWPISIPADNRVLPLLAQYLDALRTAAGEIDGAFARIAAGHVCDLVVLVLGAEGEARAAAISRGGRAARDRQILGEFDARAAGPGLSPGAIAESLAIPERRVRAALDERGEAFVERLEARRLDLAMQRLRRRDLDRLTIAEIAALSGFADAARFRRRFCLRFGETPSEARAHKPN